MTIDFKSEELREFGNVIVEKHIITIVKTQNIDLIRILLKHITRNQLEYVLVWCDKDLKLEDERLTFLSQFLMDKLLEIYRLYDFSDKITVVSESNQYGTLLNYVKTGILTMEEMVDALLYQPKTN